MPGIQIGVDKLYYALCNQDDSTGLAYGTPVLIPGAIKIGLDFGGSVDTLFADDGPSDAAATVGQMKVSLNVKDLDLDTQAALLGHTINGGVMDQASSDQPPEVAILCRSLKSNGSYRYLKVLKGKFAVPKADMETRADKVKYQTRTIEGHFLRRVYDNKYVRTGDEDHADWVAQTGTDWFTTVEAAPSALTITPSPVDAATGVADASSITFTFNNAINAKMATGDYFYVMKVSDGTLVPATVSVDSTHKVVTIAPSSSLAAATDYIAVASGLVTDIYGQKVAAGATIINFTTT